MNIDNAKQDVLATVDKLKDELVRRTAESIRIRSVTPDYVGVVYDDEVGGETEVCEFVRPLLDDLRLDTELWEEGKGRGVLAGVCKGSGGGRSLILNGHVDVVPPGPDESWKVAKAFSGSVVDGRIYGRGAVDMKGPSLAAYIALKAVLEAGYRPKGDVTLEFVGGEEMGQALGSRSAVTKGYRADSVIIMEPSRGVLGPVGAGLFYLQVEIAGKATHVGLRGQMVRTGGGGDAIGVNSIEKAMVVYEAMKRLEEEWGQTKAHPLFFPGFFSLHPGAISGGPSGAFVVSDKSTIDYAVWHHPEEDPAEVKKEIEDQISRFSRTDPWLRENPPKLHWLAQLGGFNTSLDAPICQAVHNAYEQATGRRHLPTAYEAGCDAPAFLEAGMTDVVCCGPGSFEVAHAPDEHVDIGELTDCARVLALSIVEYCGI